MPPLFIRFGLPPTDGRSRTYTEDGIIELGVSVLGRAAASGDGWDLVDPERAATVSSKFGPWLLEARRAPIVVLLMPIAIVTGDELDSRGCDGEPLLRDVRVVDVLHPTRISWDGSRCHMARGLQPGRGDCYYWPDPRVFKAPAALEPLRRALLAMPRSGATPPPLPPNLHRPAEAWFARPSSVHGVAHTKRVLVHVLELAEELRAPEDVRQAATLAALWHDVGRTCDGVEPWHGFKSARKVAALGLDSGMPAAVRRAALFAVVHHCTDEERARHLARSPLDLRVLELLKDADALDRVRLGDLDLRFLRFPQSPQRVARALELLELVPEGAGQ